MLLAGKQFSKDVIKESLVDATLLSKSLCVSVTFSDEIKLTELTKLLPESQPRRSVFAGA